VIRTERLTKSFDRGAPVIADVSTRIERGMTTVILGPSGTGKSVFAKLCIGLLRPDSGAVFLNDVELSALSERELYKVREKVGMCFQDGALFDSLSVGENVAFPIRRHLALPETEIRRIVREKLDRVGLPDAAPLMPAELSGGMRKRVGIARAIALDPELVIFDEPTSGLDPVMADAIDQLILEMRGGGRTFLVISHDLESTVRIADRVGMLHEGRMLAMGHRREILASREPVIRQFFSRLDKATR